jgi:hypothetical protein
MNASAVGYAVEERSNALHTSRKLGLRVPALVLSMIATMVVTGTFPIPDHLSRMISGVAMACVSLIGAIEMAYRVDELRENSEKISKDFYSIFIEIFTVLGVKAEHRRQEPVTFFNHIVEKYQTLVALTKADSKHSMKNPMVRQILADTQKFLKENPISVPSTPVSLFPRSTQPPRLRRSTGPTMGSANLKRSPLVLAPLSMDRSPSPARNRPEPLNTSTSVQGIRSMSEEVTAMLEGEQKLETST